METNETRCRICLIRDMAEKEDIFSYIQRTRDLLSPKERADDQLYEQRLDLCMSCPNLLAATCQKCGCYVEIRAASLNAHCPMKKRRW